MKTQTEQKKRIAVIFGGCSTEYEVSLQSAYAVISNFPEEKYEPLLIGITRSGDWYYFKGDVEKINDNTWFNEADCIPAAVSPNRSDSSVILLGDDEIKRVHIEAALPILHGKNGEDGTVQGVFELAGIPVAGCGVLCSALCMDKDMAHKVAEAAGVRVPRSLALKKGYDIADVLAKTSKIGYPVFVKPVKAGSSFGVTKVKDKEMLSDAIETAFKYDDTVLIEEGISGFEVCAGVMGNDTIKVGEVGEIEITGDAFDFTEKYTPTTTTIHVPARIDSETTEKVKKTAEVLYRALNCRVFARIDMFLTDTKEIVFNEANTIPGFTSHSLYPTSFKASGMSFEQIVEKIIELALIN